MLEKSLRILQCPLCHHSFRIKRVVTYSVFGLPTPSDVNIIFGSVECKCREYPIVQGILYLAEKNRKSTLKLIHSRNFTKSVDELVDFPKGVNKIIKLLKPWGRLDRTLWKYGKSTTTLFAHQSWVLWLMWVLGGFEPWVRYLLRRNNHPTYIHSLVNISLVRKGYAVDVGSGMGHFASELQQYAERGKVFAIDNSFWNLYLSAIKNSEVNHIYVDVEKGLPFKNKQISFVSLNDCFHLFQNQKIVSKEVKRILAKKACVIICHIHNQFSQQYAHFSPLGFAGLRKLFSSLRGFAVSEREFHQDFVLHRKKKKLSTYLIPNQEKVPIQVNQSISYLAYFLNFIPQKELLFLLPEIAKKVHGRKINYFEDQWLLEK